MRRALTGGGLIIAFSCALALSVSPKLHERVHPDANRADHMCAVTIFAAGNCEHTTAAPITIAAPAPPSAPAFLPERLSIFTAPVGMSVLEHAPPQNS
jgi:hypothetical protein